MDIGEILGKIGFDTRVFLFNLINFTILALLLQKLFFKKIVSIIEERSQSIEQGLKDAQAAKEELENVKIKGEKIVSQAKQEAGEIVREANEAAKKGVEKLKADAEMEAKEIVEKGRQQSEKDKELAMKEFRQGAADLVLKATEKLIGEKSKKTSKTEVENILSSTDFSSKS